MSEPVAEAGWYLAYGYGIKPLVVYATRGMTVWTYDLGATGTSWPTTEGRAGGTCVRFDPGAINYVDGYPAGIYLFGSPGETVEWWVFAEPQGAPSNVGLKIYNAAQQLMFDAGKKVARVVDLRAGPGNGNWQGNIGMPAGGRKWAVLPLVNAFSSVMTFTRAGAGGPDQYWQRENVSVAGGAVLGDKVVLGMTPQSMRQYGPYTGTQVPAGYTVASQNAAMAVMDMTGY